MSDVTIEDRRESRRDRFRAAALHLQSAPHISAYYPTMSSIDTKHFDDEEVRWALVSPGRNLAAHQQGLDIIEDFFSDPETPSEVNSSTSPSHVTSQQATKNGLIHDNQLPHHDHLLHDMAKATIEEQQEEEQKKDTLKTPQNSGNKSPHVEGIYDMGYSPVHIAEELQKSKHPILNAHNDLQIAIAMETPPSDEAAQQKDVNLTLATSTVSTPSVVITPDIVSHGTHQTATKVKPSATTADLLNDVLNATMKDKEKSSTPSLLKPAFDDGQKQKKKRKMPARSHYAPRKRRVITQGEAVEISSLVKPDGMHKQDILSEETKQEATIGAGHHQENGAEEKDIDEMGDSKEGDAEDLDIDHVGSHKETDPKDSVTINAGITKETVTDDADTKVKPHTDDAATKKENKANAPRSRTAVSGKELQSLAPMQQGGFFDQSSKHTERKTRTQIAAEKEAAAAAAAAALAAKDKKRRGKKK